MSSYAVLTGDVVESGTLLEEDVDYRDRLETSIAELEREFESDLVGAVDRFSGDRLQWLLETPALSLRSALFLQSHLLSEKPPVGLRVSVGIGPIDGIPDGRISQGDGEAYRISGQVLDAFGTHERLRMVFGDSHPLSSWNGLFGGTSALLSAILLELAPGEARDLWHRLQGYSQAEIGERTGTSQQAVSKSLRSAHWPALDDFLTAFEALEHE